MPWPTTLPKVAIPSVLLFIISYGFFSPVVASYPMLGKLNNALSSTFQVAAPNPWSTPDFLSESTASSDRLWFNCSNNDLPWVGDCANGGVGTCTWDWFFNFSSNSKVNLSAIF